jgi:hypothetical protein
LVGGLLVLFILAGVVMMRGGGPTTTSAAPIGLEIAGAAPAEETTAEGDDREPETEAAAAEFPPDVIGGGQ